MLLLGAPALVLAGEPNCDTFVDSAPHTISAPGHYCLAQNLAYATASGSALTIDADLVVLDLRGYTIAGSAGAGSTAMGIRVSNQSNVTIRYGTVRGFYTGIAFDGSYAVASNSKNLVEDIQTDANTRFGIWFSDLGANNAVRNCRITDTGGTTVSSSYTAGLWLQSADSLALDNVISGTRPAGAGTTLFWLRLTARGRAIDNQVMNAVSGSSSYCFYFSFGAIYKDNIASGCGTTYGGNGAAVGTTNHP